MERKTRNSLHPLWIQFYRKKKRGGVKEAHNE